MSTHVTVPSTTMASEATEGESKTLLGFWIYLMTDCILFASLFATYVVLRGATNGGPSGADLFDLPYVLAETVILLTSSYACGLAMLSLHRQQTRHIIGWLIVTFLLGAGFLAMELNEFTQLATEGNGWTMSAFLSAFFTLVGTHGAHISVGLLWIGVMIWQVASRGLTPGVSRRLTLLSLFWHFLDVIWIFIFTIVYLMGGL